MKKVIINGLVALLVCMLMASETVLGQAAAPSSQPKLFYASVGSSVVLSCTSASGQLACYSSYIYQNTAFDMANISSSLKYQINPGSIGINNVKPTDAGFYACSNDCRNIKISQISYYLQPTDTNNQPILIAKKDFVAIPPFPVNNPSLDPMFVIVTNEASQNAANTGALSVGEIIGLICGIVFAVLLIIAIVILLCCIQRKRKQKREKILEIEPKSEKDTTSIHTETVSEHNIDENGEQNSLSMNKHDQNGNIKTKDIAGPTVINSKLLKGMNPKDLPNMDINESSRTHSQLSQSQQGSYIANQPNWKASSNQGSYLASRKSSQDSHNIQAHEVPRPTRKGDSRTPSQNGSLGGVFIQPPPPNKAPVNNKVQFPARNTPQSFVSDENLNLKQIVKETGFNPSIRNNSVNLPQYVSDDENLNLQQIIKESGFLADEILAPFDTSDDFKQAQPSRKPGLNRNKDNGYEEELRQPQFIPSTPLDYDEEPRQPYLKPRQSDYDADGARKPSKAISGDVNGGVTVVSARTPSIGGGASGQTQALTILPPTANRLPQPKYSLQSNQLNQKPLLPHLSYSQRIETTSTPLQQAQQPSKSLRTSNTGQQALSTPASKPASDLNLKEGSTDV